MFKAIVDLRSKAVGLEFKAVVRMPQAVDFFQIGNVITLIAGAFRAVITALNQQGRYAFITFAIALSVDIVLITIDAKGLA